MIDSTFYGSQDSAAMAWTRYRLWCSHSLMGIIVFYLNITCDGNNSSSSDVI